MNEKEKRIRISIQLPSIGLMNFIEKALQDDKFFEAAIENPLGVLKENGIRLNVRQVRPKDLATFFGALTGAREMIRKRNIKDIKFENVFGEAADIRGATLIAETDKGMWTKFNRDAFADKEICSSVKVKFNSFRDIAGDTLADSQIYRESQVQRETNVFRIAEVSFAGAQEQFQSTDTGVTFHFDANQGIGSKTSSSVDTYRTQNFKGFGKIDEVIEQIFNGPLINPADLSNIAAQINTFVNISEQQY
jgi:hypothetical protein